MRISDWSSDVCSSDLPVDRNGIFSAREPVAARDQGRRQYGGGLAGERLCPRAAAADARLSARARFGLCRHDPVEPCGEYMERRAACVLLRSEEHTSELQSLMRISYAVLCLKKKNKTTS